MAEDTGKTEGFLSRWSRRKRELEEAEPADEPAPEDPQLSSEADAPDLEAEENRLAAEAIDIESLVKGDDFSVFLKRGVPELLRKQALRKLWRTNPIFANLDGLNDYDEDFRNPAHNVYKSLWQVGRGFLSVEEQETQQATGRISRDAVVAESAEDDAEPAQDVSEAEAQSPLVVDDEIVLPEMSEDDAGVVLTGSDDAAVETALEPAPASDPDDAEQPRPRVSIRRRLEG